MSFDFSNLPIDSLEKHDAFMKSERKHVLMITNHGIHQWQIIPGLPDTGGQNVFVNKFTAEMVRLGFKVTIANRGGYPHPRTNERRCGLRYKDEHQRIVYLEDDKSEFIRKEDMVEQVEQLAAWLGAFMEAEGTKVDLIISHYWDGAQIGVLYNRALSERVKHYWVPHSIGSIKKRNVSPDQWEELRIDERIEIEHDFMSELDGVAATSAAIREAALNDYDYSGRILYLPPCVDTELYHPRDIAKDDAVWDFLSEHSGLTPEELRERKIVTEISRTDTTKRKDVLIKAFAKIQERVPKCLLVVSVDDNKEELAGKLRKLIDEGDLRDYVAVYIPDEVLPQIYAVTDVYCTPSVMEGFGMSAQEAAASGAPVVASDLVPFVSEFLLGDGDEVEVVEFAAGHEPLKLGEGAIVVKADDVEGFTHAVEMLLTADDLRERMAKSAYHITIPYFTWPNRVAAFLEEISVSP